MRCGGTELNMTENKISAAEFIILLKENAERKLRETYRITDRLVLESGSKLCNIEEIIADKGIEINGEGVSLFRCRIISEAGIDISGDDVSIAECEINARIASSGKCFIARDNKITGDVILESGSESSLLAQNTVDGTVGVRESFNCAVVLNGARRIKAENSKDLYVIKNTLAEAIEMSCNKYLICDENTVSSVTLQGNSDFNGDNIQDLSRRAEYGSNDELLPHTDKEQFIGMERRDTVTDPTSERSCSLAEYIVENAKANDVVIIPPGAYKVESGFIIGAEQSNTEIYAYGVYAEAAYLGQIMHVNGAENVIFRGLTFGYAPAVSGQVEVVELLGDNKITVVNTAGFDEGFGKSDTAKYNIGQTYIYRHDEPGIWGGMANAYFIDDNGDGTYTVTFADPFGTYERLRVGDIITCRMAGSSSQTVLSHNAVNVKYKDITLFGYGAATAFRTKDGCDGVSFERYCLTNRAPYVIDKETYDRYKAWEERYGVDLEVYIDELGRYRGGVPRIGGIGGMEVENAKTGVCLTSCLIENIVDDGSNQRGTSGRVGGIKQNADGTYTVYYKGSLSSVYHQAVFSRTAYNTGKSDFSPLCTAQVKKGDVLFAYASNSAVLFDNAIALEDAYVLTESCEHLAHIDTDGDGKCDICGSELKKEGIKDPAVETGYHPEDGRVTFKVKNSLPGGPMMLDYTTFIYAVRIEAPEGVNMSALSGYDLLSNDYDSKTQVFFDNVGKNCACFMFDNVKVQNNVARGLLVKTRGVEVKNCTFKGQNLQGMIIGRETNWGESSIPRNVKIEDCIFDSTGYSYKNADGKVSFAQINIQGLGEVNNSITLSENFACANITIRHNKFLSTTNRHVIHASGAKELSITENIFEEREGDGKVIYLNGCLDVDISNNQYSEKMQKCIESGDIDKVFSLYKHKNVTVEGRRIADNDRDPE